MFIGRYPKQIGKHRKMVVTGRKGISTGKKRKSWEKGNQPHCSSNKAKYCVLTRVLSDSSVSSKLNYNYNEVRGKMRYPKPDSNHLKQSITRMVEM